MVEMVDNPASTCNRRPFRIETTVAGSLPRPLRRAILSAVEHALALPALNDVYVEINRRLAEGRHFTDTALDVLNARTLVLGNGPGRIPETGPLVVVANHPFGGIEGLILCSVIRRVRPDVKLLANYMLSVIPELRDSFIFVDPFDGPGAVRRNVAAMREATQWVADGGALGVFPAGEVSHLNLNKRSMADPDWSRTVGKIVKRTGATVVPAFFYGHNSALFQVAGMIHPRVRTTMLVRELLRKRGQTFRLRIGSAIPPTRLESFCDPDALTSYLRVRTYILKSREARRERERRLNLATNAAKGEPIADPQPVEAMIDEVASLPKDQRLLTSGGMDVVIGEAGQLPTVLREIGRLREVTFRKVGEGTGRATDLDRFDKHYLHLIVWDRDEARVVGAYRLGLTDRILPTFGIDGLYTSTLFRFKRQLLEQISPAIELGRSFIHPDHQRRFSPLMLLWQGIGRFVAKNMRYRHLFGTVSISAEYSSMSKQLLMSFLQNQRSLPQLSGLLKPKNPPRQRPHADWDPAEFSTVVNDVNGVNELLADLEADGKQMPVLLRQYLKLNGNLLGLNIDPEFGNVLDGLMLFDVLDIPRPILNKYMGPDKVPGYLACHNAME
jgi:putative hemolysin